MGSSTSSLPFKILLISTGILSLAMAMNSFIPSMLNFAIHDIPIIWFVILSWLKPPYLYVVINAIIITIAASSRLHHHYYYNTDDHETSSSIPPQELLVDHEPGFGAIEHDVKEYEVSHGIEQAKVVDVEMVLEKDCCEVVANESEDKFVVSGSVWNSSQRLVSPPAGIIQQEFVRPLVREKPLVKSRFANHRRTTKINPEGVRSLRVAKPKKHETLESTWKTITDGRHMPLNRHLKKSDTFENNHHHHMEAHPEEQQRPIHEVVDYNIMNKSETFNDRTDYQNHRVLSSKTSLRKEGSLSHDDLNRRVEAFIKKFNDEMRLQRQESLQRYMDMINRGAE